MTTDTVSVRFNLPKKTNHMNGRGMVGETQRFKMIKNKSPC